jgi:hypothetical protein
MPDWFVFDAEENAVVFHSALFILNSALYFGPRGWYRAKSLRTAIILLFREALICLSYSGSLRTAMTCARL